MGTTSYREKLSHLIAMAEAEIDELRLKVSLGRMEGADIFEELKEEVRHSMHDITKDLKKEKSESIPAMHSLLDAFRNYVEEGKASTLIEYEDQKSRILEAIVHLEEILRDARIALSPGLRLKIQNELEKFRLKMEVLQIRYELGKLEMKDNVEERKQKFRKQFEFLLASIPESTSDSLEAYGRELKDAYDKLREMINNK